MSSTVSSDSAHKMGVVALTLVTASNMMGSGVFLLPTNLANIGAISTFGWIFTIIGVLALALVFAKTSLIHQKVGGIVAYARDAFGPFVGFQATTAYWISAWVGNVALLVAGVGYLSFFFPSLSDGTMMNVMGLHVATGAFYSCITAIVILWLYVVLSSFGAKVAGSAQSFTATCMLIVVLGTGIFGWFFFKSSTFMEVVKVDQTQSNFSAILAAASLALWGFLGVESAVVSTGQVKEPEKTVPKATVLGLLIAAICYVASSTVIMGIVPHDVLVKSNAPFADAIKYMFDSQMAGNIASGMSILACFGSISGWFILQSEAPRAAAESGLYPKFFAELNKNGVPLKGLIFTAVLMSIVLGLTASPDLAKQFEIVILMSVFCSLIPYIYAIIALPIIMAGKKMNASSGAMFYTILVAIGLIYSMFALVGSGTGSIFWGTMMVTLCIPMYSFVAVSRAKQGKEILYEDESEQ